LQAIKNQDEGAERSLLQALRLAPRNSSLRADFALLLARQGGRLDDALREADLALKGRETAEALDAKARVLIERDQAAEALTLAERAAKREPREPAWQATLAVALARAGQTEAAREKFRPLKQKNGDPWSDLKTLSMLRFYGKHFLDTLDTLARG
jgi:Flp pilus assembly protein TadD